MLEHALPPAAFADLEAHIDSCEACRKIVAAAVTADDLADGTPAPALTDAALPRGTIAGHYVIESLLGRGGMGAVYLARDRKLDREVALKLHRAKSAGERLQREAMAMAKLAHPNVVTVFEVTSIDDRLCVAMEYVRGDTLRGWLARKPRRWREIVALLAEAGGGLAAAHDAGLVHRDYKPENVLVGEDGRPRVGDFGLARVGAMADSAPSAAELTALNTPMTATGTVLGTPAYMAPEQLAGEVVDARADQFAFCVVAWECLYGKRPFAGATLGALQEAIERHELAAPKSEVPERVRAAIARGLAIDPRDRYPDMRALLAAVRDAARSRRARRIAIAAAAVLALGGAGFAGATVIGAHRREAACESEGDAIRARFSDRVRSDLRAAFRASGAPDADGAYEHASTVLARTTDALAVQAVATCRGRGEPERMTAARRACLAEHDSELANVIDVLGRADKAMVGRAAMAAWAIYDAKPCDDTRTLLAAPQATVARAPELVARLGRARALHDAGRYREAIATVEPLVADAVARGDRGLELQATTLLGQLREQTDAPKMVMPILQRAVALAEAQGRDLDAAISLNSMANFTGVVIKDHDAGRRYVDLARAKLERLGDGNLAAKGALFATAGQIESDDNNLGVAESDLRQATVLLEQALGADHPRLGSSFGTLTQILLYEGKLADAHAAGERTLAILSHALGDDHPTVAGARMTLASVLMAEKHFDEARTLLLRADEVFAHVYGDVHPTRAAIYGNLGGLEQMQEHWDAALDADRKAQAILEKLEGPETLDVSGVRRDTARVLALSGRIDEAIAEEQKAIDILAHVGDDGASRMPSALVELADMQLDRKHPELALPIAERAVKLAEARPADANPGELADARFLLARTLDLMKRDPKRVRALVEQAQKTASEESKPAIDAWLTAHAH
jgi:tetratricopeptide (TPR) repeat protein/tRNA A-37 threonylcarbamoyl transferase component Bud32